MSAPDLSVVVVTHNGRELSLATLRSALANAGPIDVEWLVADSGSTDGTPEAIERELPGTQVIRCMNLGFAHGNNVALDRAAGRYVLLLNPDVEIERGTLAELVEALDERPGVGAASVVQRAANGTLLPSIRRFPSPVRDLGEALFCARWPVLRQLQELDVDFDRYFEERHADWVSGAFLIARREAVDQVGPLDERFFLYSEEIDWCYRIRGAGWDIRHLPVMEITHHCGPNSPERTAELGHSRVLFARKHFGPMRAAAIRCALALGHALRMALLAPSSLLAPARRARLRTEAFGFAAVAGVMRPPLSLRARAAVETPRGR
jgi:N-acetylglucosaminyl-diphospho-decaprenol L-rhamnosyltransferase